MINQNVILYQRVSILVFIALNLCGESIVVFIVLNLCGESIEMQSSILLNFPFLRMGGCCHVHDWMQLFISGCLGNMLY